MWHASVAVKDLLNRVTVLITSSMEKSIVAFSTRRCTDHLLACLVCFAKLALGLTILGLMVPGPIETQGTTIRLLDYVGPLFERLSREDPTDRQSIFVEDFTIGICTCMLIPAGWASLRWVLLCAMGLLGALSRLFRTLREPVSNLVAAVASNLGV